jgi:hypothetical protein
MVASCTARIARSLTEVDDEAANQDAMRSSTVPTASPGARAVSSS